MNFKILLDVLISEDVYNQIKNNESELFDLIPEFHSLISNINSQEQMMLTLEK